MSKGSVLHKDGASIHPSIHLLINTPHQTSAPHQAGTWLDLSWHRQAHPKGWDGTWHQATLVARSLLAKEVSPAPYT